MVTYLALYYDISMKPSNLNSLKYFKGKVCTIFMPTSSLPFDEETARQHFTLRVQDVDPEGLWGTNLTTDTVSFFRWQHIMAIQQELELNPEDPKHAELIQHYEQKQEQQVEPAAPACTGCGSQSDVPAASQPGDATFINIDSLTQLARQTRHSYDNMR